MRFLIDGYNLMHAAGYLTSKPSGRLDPIRKRFLDWLAQVARKNSVEMTVVFDGQSSPRTSSETDHRGVNVRFSSGRTADDEIESLLVIGIVVVSNDSRLHEAARRAKADAWRCERFLDWVIADAEPPVPQAVEVEKPTGGGNEADLLAAFRQPRGRR